MPKDVAFDAFCRRRWRRERSTSVVSASLQRLSLGSTSLASAQRRLRTTWPSATVHRHGVGRAPAYADLAAYLRRVPCCTTSGYASTSGRWRFDDAVSRAAISLDGIRGGGRARWTSGGSRHNTRRVRAGSRESSGRHERDERRVPSAVRRTGVAG